MFNEKLKEAFAKIKEDIAHLDQEITLMKAQISQIYDYLTQINESDTYQTETRHIIKNQTDIPSNIEELSLNSVSSIGNEGVPTDRQTDRQTQNTPEIQKNPVDNAIEILDSLDSIKKEIRLKFRRLTDQEMLIFSTIYQLEEENGHTDYKTVSEKLKLTESSIRDYVGRLIKKGIPVEKTKINNKSIQLKISENLKKITNLPTIMQLRDL